MQAIQGRLTASFCENKDRIALIYGEKQVDYGELHKNSSRIAQTMAAKGIKCGTHIGVLTADREVMVTAILGILIAGCVFVPLDPAYPFQRLRQMIQVAEISYLISDQDCKNLLSEYTGTMALSYASLSSPVDTGIFSSPSYEPMSPAYIFFTSGTTGVPKAILGKCQSLLQFCEWEIETFSITNRSRISQLTSPSFDAFLRDIFPALLTGASVCIPKNRDELLAPDALVKWVNDSEITLLHCTPSIFKLLSTGTSGAGDFPQLQYVLMAGEQILPSMLKEWYAAFGARIQLVNLYGTSETTMIKTYYKIKEQDVSRITIPIGKAMKGARVIVLNSGMKVCKPGETGEIYVRSPYMTYGYYGDQAETNRWFIPNPFSSDPSDLIYRTGDLGYMLEDGTLEFKGRIDRQVKIRGIRVELGEVEAVLSSFDGVDRCVADIWDGVGPVAYIVPSGGFDKIRLASQLKEIAPLHLVPAVIHSVSSIPVTINGKTDYAALRALAGQGNEALSPRTVTEDKLSLIWKEILRRDSISITDEFMKLGGHSLNIMTLISRVFQEFGVEYPLSEVFQGVTIEKMALNILHARKKGLQVIEPAEVCGSYPLSPAQLRMFILSQFKTVGAAFNMPVHIFIEGKVDERKLQECFASLIRRHEALRTSFGYEDKTPVQYIHETVDFMLEQEQAGEEQADERMAAFIRPFDLKTAPLIRAKLVSYSDIRSSLMIDMHHIISDGTSAAIMVRDLLNLYQGQALAPLAIQYKDYQAWHKRFMDSEQAGKQERYWLSALNGALPKLEFPTDHPKTWMRSFKGDTLVDYLPPDILPRLRSVMVENQATLYMVLLAAYFILLHKYTGKEDILVGTPTAGRIHPDLESVMGIFLNTLTLRGRPSGKKTITEFLQEVRQTALNAFENQEYPVEAVIEKLGLQAGFGEDPLFETMFAVNNFDWPSGCQMPDLRFDVRNEFATQTAKYILGMDITETDKGFMLKMEYATKQLDKGTAQAVLRDYITVIKKLVQNPDWRIQDLCMYVA